VQQELAAITPILTEYGYGLDAVQPHLAGERYLMQAITTKSGRKLILLGQRIDDGTRVVIKATSDTRGISEIEHERVARRVLQEIKFAYHVFHSPEEFSFIKENGYVISVQAFIEQEQPFLARPLPEQFSFALAAFKAQESAHATTYGHIRLIQKTFGSMSTQKYLDTFASFRNNILSHPSHTERIGDALQKAGTFLKENENTIEQYGNFLTHTDFVPHNFRIAHGQMYLLDHSSLRFGNKYEGWARFLNFMTLYNRALEEALVKYVAENRTPEELLSLRLMRIYRLGEILWYYTNLLDSVSGDLRKLTEARVSFWLEVLESQLTETPIPETVVEEYKCLRDSLRSEEEKKRQEGLH
jgi:hypothetical protein